MKFTKFELDAIKATEGFSITIHELVQFAKSKGKILQHSKQINRFEQMVESLDKKLKTDLKQNLLQVNFKVKDSSGRNQDIKTYRLDLKTTLWFVSAFDHQLRYYIVDYALSQKEKEAKELRKELKRIKMTKFNDYENTHKTVSRFIVENDLKISATELLDRLDTEGYIETKTVKRKIRIPVNEDIKRTKDNALLVPIEILKKVTI